MHQLIPRITFLLITEMFGWINGLVLLYLIRLHALLLVSDQKKTKTKTKQYNQNYGGIILLET